VCVENEGGTLKLYELTRWYAYRRIDHPSMRFYTMVVPTCFAVLFTIVIAILPGQITLSGEGGFLSGIIGAISLLPGFYIASLAAVATFSGKHMDEDMPAPAPKINIRTAQTNGPETLTRRMFLSYLFGYLAISSLLLVSLSFVMDMVAPGVSQLITTYATNWGECIIFGLELLIVFMLSFVVGSILVTTLHGTYYLMERIFQPT
jgi:hypothetical protein